MLLPTPLCALLLALPATQEPSPSSDHAAGHPSGPLEHFESADWHELFDGQSLDGWTTRGGRYDGDAAWTIEDGVLVGREDQNRGGLLYTETAYANFAFAVDVWIDWPFDSGIFVRMLPPERELKGAQVTIDYRPGGEVGAIYADGFLAHNETASEQLVKDGWNHFEVLCVGADMHLQAWMNGALIADHQVPAGSAGFARRGLIGLQVHGGGGDQTARSAVRFKNMRLLELPDFDPQLFSVNELGQLEPTAAGLQLGWKPLFSGADFSAWEEIGNQNRTPGWELAEGVLAFRSRGPGGYVRTLADYEDFELQLDFKTGRMANSGLFLRGDRAASDPAYSGCEIQILDDFNWEAVTQSALQPNQFTGSLYGAVARGVTDALYPLGHWNTYRVRYVGSRLRATLNGAELFDVDTLELEAQPPFAQRAPRGFIGLQRHAPAQVEGTHYAWFRNAFVRPLDY